MDGTIRVLHVDDDPNITELTASFLERAEEDFDVVTATSAREGLDLVEAERVDCVVSDYQMPGLDGFDFLAALRERDPDLPFILFTGKGSEEIASEAISAGVTDYLQKESGSSKYELLANRIVNAVEQYGTGRTAPAEAGRAPAARGTASSPDRPVGATPASTDRGPLSESDLGDVLSDLLGMYAVVREDDGTEVIADCNGAFAARLTYSRDSLRGEPLTTVLPDEEVGTGDSAQGAVVDGASGMDGSWAELTLETADGERVRMRYRSSPDVDVDVGAGALADGGTLVAFDEPTERRELEAEVEWYQELINTIPDAIYALDDDMHYLYVNEGMADLTGYDRERIIGAHKSLVNTDKSVESGRLKRQELREDDPDGMKVGFHPHVTAEGEHIPTEVRFRALPTDDDEEFRGTAGVVRDVTDRLERERELERQNRRLEEFASVVSHDLRNPLNVAVGRVELGRQDCECGGADEHLAKASSELERMADIIEDVLAFARNGEAVTEPEPVSVRSVVEDAWAAVDATEARLDVATDLTVRANRLRLQRLFENLFRNAVEHAGESATVRVGDLARPATASGDPDGVSGFYVEDDGPGIPLEDREEVLEPGVTTADDGTGFGLAIVKTITESHGWSLAVTEGTDGGARFEVTDAEPVDPADEHAETAGAS